MKELKTHTLARMTPKDNHLYVLAPGVLMTLPGTIELSGKSFDIGTLQHSVYLQDRTNSCMVSLQKKLSGSKVIAEGTEVILRVQSLAYTCGVCLQEISDNESCVQCDGCNHWYHTTACVKVVDESVEFICAFCQLSLDNLPDLRKQFNSFEDDVQNPYQVYKKLADKVFAGVADFTVRAKCLNIVWNKLKSADKAYENCIAAGST